MPVHEQLPSKALAEHLLGNLLVGRSLDGGDDHDPPGLLEQLLDDGAARAVRVLHAGGVHQDDRGVGAERPRDPHTLDEGPKGSDPFCVRAVHVLKDLPGHRRSLPVREAQELRHGVLRGHPVPGIPQIRRRGRQTRPRLRVARPAEGLGVHRAQRVPGHLPRRRLAFSHGLPPVHPRPICHQKVRQEVLHLPRPLRGALQVHFALEGALATHAFQLDGHRSAGAPARRGHHLLREQGVQQRALACAGGPEQRDVDLTGLRGLLRPPQLVRALSGEFLRQRRGRLRGLAVEHLTDAADDAL
mmetsp:Transcript_108141/g.306669  ORF Transcript_108141/g.306669 Transcript_108141/m.306669 type:complete len:301 (-) Transcript_108141:216-1118(-)